MKYSNLIPVLLAAYVLSACGTQEGPSLLSSTNPPGPTGSWGINFDVTYKGTCGNQVTLEAKCSSGTPSIEITQALGNETYSLTCPRDESIQVTQKSFTKGSCKYNVFDVNGASQTWQGRAANNITVTDELSLVRGNIDNQNIEIEIDNSGAARSAITIFATAAVGPLFANNGEGDARLGADRYCASRHLSHHFEQFSCPGKVMALLATSIQDAPKNFVAEYSVPTALAIVGPSGTALAASWSALLGGTLTSSFKDAGVFTGNASYYTGMTSFAANDPRNGSFSGEYSAEFTNCEGWTAVPAQGVSRTSAGYSTASDRWWMNMGNGICNASQPLPITCLCW